MAEDDPTNGPGLTDRIAPPERSTASRRLRNLASGNATAAVMSQGVQAAVSLGLQLLALKELGRAGLGAFSLLTAGVVVTFTAVHTGWIGDALQVFDRSRPTMRRALAISRIISALMAVLVGIVTAMLMADRGAASAALFALTLVAWTVEETGRRIFMARLDFWGLLRNDLVYAAGATVVALTAVVLGRVSIDALLGAMLVGAVASILQGRRTLPREEFDLEVRGPNDMAALARFSGWRAGQITVRPLSMLVVRIVVVSATSLAGLGLLEAGRLVLAPVFTTVNGIGAFLLPTFAKTVDDDRATMRLVLKVAGVGMALTALYGVTAALVVPAIQSAMGDDSPFPPAMIIAWTVYAMANFASIPFGNALVARHRSREVFRARCIDGVIGVALAYGLVSTAGITAVPLGLALGVVAGSGWLWWWLSRAGIMVSPGSGRRVLNGPTRAAPMTAPFRTSWVAVIPMLFIVTTEFKWRQRELTTALSGSVDIAILLEIAVYGAVAAYLFAFVASPPRSSRPTAVMFMMRAYAVTLAATALLRPTPLSPRFVPANCSSWSATPTRSAPEPRGARCISWPTPTSP